MTAPGSPSALVAAANWLEHLLTGSFATAIATVAVAGLGYRFLTGQLEWRRALQVLLGIFILFGAPALVRELSATARGTASPAPAATVAPAAPPVAPRAPPQVDPYAGAAVPM